MPAIHTQDGTQAFVSIVPMQAEEDGPPNRLDLLLTAKEMGDHEGAGEDIYGYVWGESWCTGEEFYPDDYPSPEEACKAAIDRANNFIASGDWTIPEMMKAQCAGGNEGVKKYLKDIDELEKMVADPH